MTKKYEVAVRRTGSHDQPRGTRQVYGSKRQAEREATFWNKAWAMSNTRYAAVVVPAGTVPPDSRWWRRPTWKKVR